MSLRISQGGLMRCCIQTLYEKHNAGDINDGTVHTVSCSWCKNGMVCNANGVWEWDKAKALGHYRDDGK